MIKVAGYLSFVYVAILFILLSFSFKELVEVSTIIYVVFFSILSLLLLQLFFLFQAFKWLKIRVLVDVNVNKILDNGVYDAAQKTIDKPWYLWFFSLSNVALALLITLTITVLALDGVFTKEQVRDDLIYQFRRMLMLLVGILSPFLIYFNIKTLLMKFESKD